MKVRFKKLVPEAVIPAKAHPSDFGADLTVTSVKIDDYGNIVYGFGIAVEIPEGHVGLIFPRSSISKEDLILSNSVGCIDSHYRGEIMAKFVINPFIIDGPSNMDNSPVILTVTPMFAFDGEMDMEQLSHYQIGERAVQLAIIPYPEIEYEEAEELSETDRGSGGYGSSGK